MYAPFGNTGNNQRITANNPIFTMIPLSTIVTGVGDCSYVSGCQVWKGNTGILIAKATKNNQKSQDCSVLLSCMEVNVAQLKDPPGVWL